MAVLIGARFGWDPQRQSAEVEGYKAWLSHLAVPQEAA